MTKQQLDTLKPGNEVQVKLTRGWDPETGDERPPVILKGTIQGFGSTSGSAWVAVPNNDTGLRLALVLDRNIKALAG